MHIVFPSYLRLAGIPFTQSHRRMCGTNLVLRRCLPENEGSNNDVESEPNGIEPLEQKSTVSIQPEHDHFDRKFWLFLCQREFRC